MINMFEVSETNNMITQEKLDVRTITMGISLLDCIDSSVEKVCENVYNKITTLAKNLVSTGKDIEKEYGIPIVNKRISVTPIALVGSAACKTTDDFVEIAKSLDRAAKEVGVNFLGGYSALVSKGMTKAEELLIRSIPKALAVTERVCSSVNIGSTKTGINMDAVRLMGEMVKETAEYTKEQENITKLGENNVFFLPYLMGERSPHNNPDARGTFIGLTMDTTREDMTQAVLEGVAFAIRDSFEVAKSLGIQIERTKICGGGAKSPLWKKIIANVMNLKVDVLENEEGPSMGGAMLAAVGCGAYPDVETIGKKFAKVVDTVEPDPELVAKYEERYQKFRTLYPAMKPLF